MEMEVMPTAVPLCGAIRMRDVHALGREVAAQDSELRGYLSNALRFFSD